MSAWSTRSEAVLGDEVEAQITEGGRPASSLSESVHEVLSELCQSIRTEGAHQGCLEHTRKVEPSEVIDSRRHSLSGSMVACISNGCILSPWDMSADSATDTTDPADITAHIEEQRAAVEAFAALTRSSERGERVFPGKSLADPVEDVPLAELSQDPAAGSGRIMKEGSQTLTMTTASLAP